ncbi:MAG: tRNA lysidine(34) synthetase TilS, partial [Lentisphaeria bacterium]|nr:tRNA lysidine(34) synthetase TilS [Lentisphaeria bacterium]
SIQELQTPYFKVSFMGSLKEGITVSEEDLPLTIRNVREGDSIEFSFGHKKLHRYFIDQKVPYLDRKLCPVVVNRHQEVIFVCNLGYTAIRIIEKCSAAGTGSGCKQFGRSVADLNMIILCFGRIRHGDCSCIKKQHCML